MPHQETLTVRALQDAKGGVVVRSPNFLLINMNTVDEDVTEIITADFQGNQLPEPDDLEHDLLITGSRYIHARTEREQFAVMMWAVTDNKSSPPVRYKTAKKVSAAEIQRLMNPKA